MNPINKGNNFGSNIYIYIYIFHQIQILAPLFSTKLNLNLHEDNHKFKKSCRDGNEGNFNSPINLPLSSGRNFIYMKKSAITQFEKDVHANIKLNFIYFSWLNMHNMLFLMMLVDSWGAKNHMRNNLSFIFIYITYNNLK